MLGPGAGLDESRPTTGTHLYLATCFFRVAILKERNRNTRYIVVLLYPTLFAYEYTNNGYSCQLMSLYIYRKVGAIPCGRPHLSESQGDIYRKDS
jgi:hypothetical protein